MKKILLFYCIPILNLIAQGTIDPAFTIGQNLWGQTSYITVYSITEQPDHKILISGSFGTYNNYSINGIIRLNSDGTRDDSFHPGDSFLGAQTYIRKIKLLSNGKILISGKFNSFGGFPVTGIARLNSDGTVDPTFDPGTSVSNGGSLGEIFAMEIQLDGKIIIGGAFNKFNEITRNGLARLHSDGSLDLTFDPGVGVDVGNGSNLIYDLDVTTDGKIIIVGGFEMFNGLDRNCLARLNSNGSVDNSFVPASDLILANGAKRIEVVALLPSGGMILGGIFIAGNSTNSRSLLRVNSDGVNDETFTPGFGTEGTGIFDLTVRPDGKILIGGKFSKYDTANKFTIALLNSDGTLATNFNYEGFNPNFDRIYATATLDDGNILVGGQFGLRKLLATENLATNDFTSGILSIYPNPVKNILHLNTQQTIIEAKVFNIAGQEIKLSQNIFAGNTELNMENLKAGIYVIKVITNDGNVIFSKVTKS